MCEQLLNTQDSTNLWQSPNIKGESGEPGSYPSLDFFPGMTLDKSLKLSEIQFLTYK